MCAWPAWAARAAGWRPTSPSSRRCTPGCWTERPAAIAEVAAGIAAPPAAQRGLHRARHLRPRRALRRLPHRDPARICRRAGLAVARSRSTARGPTCATAWSSGCRRAAARPTWARCMRVAREQGALTLAVTNNPESPLAAGGGADDRHRRRARAGGRGDQDLHGRAAGAAACWSRASGRRRRAARGGARRLAAAGAGRGDAGRPDRRPSWPGGTGSPRRMVTTGRGYAYPTAREAALKLMETSYLPALAFSGADLLHGPLAMADPDVPVLAMVGAGPGGRAMREVLARLGERGADVVVDRPGRARRPEALHLPTPDVDERLRAAAGHPAVAAAGARAGAGPRRRSRRAPRSEEGHRHAVARRPSGVAR